MTDLPAYIWVLVFLGVVGIPATTVAMLYRGAVAAGLGRRAGASLAIPAALLLGGWITTSALLADGDVYHRASGEAAPWFGIAFAGVLIALLLFTRVPLVARALADPGTPARLAWPHTLRIVGIAFVIVMVLDKLPAVFALPAGLGDVAIGITAPFGALGLARAGRHADAVYFNLLGILDLVIALGIGFFAGLGPYHPINVTPTTERLTLLPLALVPTVAVPVAITLHIISLGRLHTDRAQAPR
jgi:hypothetical protein